MDWIQLNEDIKEAQEKRIKELEKKYQALLVVTEGFIHNAQAAVAYHKNRGKGGQQVPFFGDFCNIPLSAVKTLEWWIRAFSAVMEGKEPWKW